MVKYINVHPIIQTVIENVAITPIGLCYCEQLPPVFDAQHFNHEHVRQQVF